MDKITLACAGGFSTSMMASRMKEAAKAQGIDVDINAVAEEDIELYSDSDILLLGPQLGYRQQELQKDFSMPVLVINFQDYGSMNGKNVLNDAISKIEGEK